MDPVQANLLSKAIAFAYGDLRDWPLECPVCWSQKWELNLDTDQYLCLDCGITTTGEIMSDHQHEVARADISGRPKPRMRI